MRPCGTDCASALEVESAEDRRTGSADITIDSRCAGNPPNATAKSKSSWSRDDHEDGGPTIQLPAAQSGAAPLACLPAIEYIRRNTAGQKFRSGCRRNGVWRESRYVADDQLPQPCGGPPTLGAVLDSDHPQDIVGDIFLQLQFRRKTSKESGLAAFHPPIGQGEICRNGKCRGPQPCRDLSHRRFQHH